MFILLRYFTALLSLLLVVTGANGAYAREALTIDQIEDQIEKLKDRGKDEKRADLLYRLGEKYFESGKFESAAAKIKEAIEIEDRIYQNPSAGASNNGGFLPRVHSRVALANVYIQQKRFDQARDLYLDAIKILESLSKTGEAAKLACHLGSLELKLNMVDSAGSRFKEARDLAIKAKLAEAEVSALIGLATIERTRKQYQKALEYLKTAKSAGELDLDGIAYARLLNELGRTYSDMDLFEEAEEQYKESAKEFGDSGELGLQGQVLTALGQIYLLERKTDEALSTLTRARDLLLTEKASRDLARALVPLGSAQADSGKFKEALASHRQAASIAKKQGDSATYLLAVLEEGYDRFLGGDTEKALKCYLKADKFVDSYKGKVNTELKAAIARDCGMGARALGQVEEAVKYYESAADFFLKAGKLSDQAIMLDSIAVAYLDSGDTDNFARYHDLALGVFKNVESADGRSSRKNLRAKGALHYNQGQYCVYKGKLADAVLEYEKSLNCYREAGDQLGHCHALRGMGLAYLMLGQVGRSKDAYEGARVIASRIGNIESQWDCATGLGKVYAKLGEREKAEESLKQAVSLADKERRQFSRDSFKTAQLSLREDCFLELVELLFKDNRFEEALTIAECGRARAFLDMLEGRSTGAAPRLVSSSLIEGANSGRVEKKPEARTLVAMADTGSANTGFRSVKVRPKTGTTVSPSAISPVNAKAPDLTELQALVKRSGTYVLEYIATPKGVMIWLVDPGGKVVVGKTVDCELEELKNLIRETHKSIVTTPDGMEALHELSENRSKSLRKLYDLLIGPVASSLPTDPEQVVTVVPYGPLYLVPFAALLDPGNSYFVEKHALAYLPSIAVLRATGDMKQKLAGLDDKLLAFGNPITERNKFIGKLPYAEKEVAKVASIFNQVKQVNPDATHIEVGEAATKKKFAELAPGYSYIHLATHGLIDADSPMDSSVVLAPEGDDDGLLTVKDILELPTLRAKLIVLSACQTGKGKVTGDGVIGLSRAFIIAGTPSVMVSQWNVDDVMTEFQMALLYKELLSGQKKARALRVAQLKTINFMEKGLASSFADEGEDDEEAGKKTKDRANPRYWAAFQVIGEAD